MCRATGPTSMVHGQAVRRSLASIILTANRRNARYLRRSRVIPRSPETLYPMQTGPPRREQYSGGYRYGD